MKTKKFDNPVEGIMSFLYSQTGGFGPLQRLSNETIHDGKIIIDTTLPGDTNIWETGVKRFDIEGKWIIVEQYENKEKAVEGQAKWVKTLTEYPDFPLKDIDLWNLDKYL